MRSCSLHPAGEGGRVCMPPSPTASTQPRAAPWLQGPLVWEERLLGSGGVCVCSHSPCCERSTSRQWVGLVCVCVCVCVCTPAVLCPLLPGPVCPCVCVCVCVHACSFGPVSPPARPRLLTPRPWCVVGASRLLLSPECLVASGRCPVRSPPGGSEVRSSWPQPPRPALTTGSAALRAPSELC